MFNLIKVKKSIDCKKIYFCNIPVYIKQENDNYVERSYLGILCGTKKYKYKKKYYFCKIKFCEKINYEKILTDNSNRNLENSLKREILKLKTLIQCQTLHKETFGPYKNAFNDKTVVLVASGPTAQYHIQKENAIYVGVNNACLLEKVKLDYLFCQDFYMNEEKRNAIVNYRPNKCKKFFGRIPDLRYANCLKSNSAKHVRRCPKYIVEIAHAKEYYVQDEGENSFALDIENEPLSPSGITFSALQFILHCHPKKIYLVGCDCSSGFFYNSDITFNTQYQINFWKNIKKHIVHLYPDIEIISLNPVGLKGLFKDEYTDNYLESLDEKERVEINV